jgi:hypothetical protein
MFCGLLQLTVAHVISLFPDMRRILIKRVIRSIEKDQYSWPTICPKMMRDLWSDISWPLMCLIDDVDKQTPISTFSSSQDMCWFRV